MVYVETKSHIVNSLGSVHRSGRGEDLAVQLWGEKCWNSWCLAPSLSEAILLAASAHLSGREAWWEEKLTRSWRETCSASREGGAEEERNCCHGQRPAVFLGSACSINSAEEAPRSQPVENWALEADAASCSLMGSEAIQGWAVPIIPTQLSFPSSVVGPPPPHRYSLSLQPFAASLVTCL